MAKTRNTYDLGGGYSYRFLAWSPDRKLNPQFHESTHPDVEKCGIIMTCPHGNGGIHFIIPGHPLFQDGWTVISLDPLTLTPSLDRKECGCHGFITDGKWISA